jgi:hypothetical protein
VNPATFKRLLDEVLNAQMHRDGWDQPPSLKLMWMNNGRIQVSDDVVPEFMWRQMSPGDVLERAAQRLPGSMLSMMMAAKPATNLCGVLFFVEAWMVDVHAMDKERANQVMTDAQNRRIYQRPDRIEIRQCTAATDQGIRSVRERRDGVDVSVEPGVEAGRVPDSLMALYLHLKGRRQN